MKRRYVAFPLFLFTLFPVLVFAAQSAGFVQGNISYSKDPFEEGDKVKIYTVIFNPDARELSGTVLFFDKTVLLGKKNFTVSGGGAEAVSIDWTAMAGDHVISAKIENAKFLISKDKYESVFLPENQSEESKRTVSKKIVAKASEAGEKGGSSIPSEIENIENIIIEKTPAFIAKPITSAVDKLEDFRTNSSANVEVKKENTREEIENLNAADEKGVQTNSAKKPFEYAKLYFYSLLSFILNSKFLFYATLLGLIFSLVRYIFNLIL